MTSGSSQDSSKDGSSGSRSRRHGLWWAVGLIGVSMLVLLLAFWLWWRQGSLEQKIEAALQGQLGVAVTLEQPLEMDFWPQLQISAAGLSVAQPEYSATDQPLLVARKIRVEVPWRDLLAGSIGGADIEAGSVEIQLGVTPAGYPDFSSLNALGESQTGSGTGTLPSLRIEDLLMRTVDDRWRLRLHPLQMGHGLKQAAVVQLDTPVILAEGLLEITMQASQLVLHARRLTLDLPAWPNSIGLTFQGRVDPGTGSIHVPEFNAQSSDILALTGTVDATWDPVVSAQSSFRIRLTNSLAPVQGTGPALDADAELAWEDQRVELAARGSLGGSDMTVSAAACLDQPVRLGVGAQITRLDLEDWVVPGSGPFTESGNDSNAVIALRIQVEEFVDEDFRAEDTVVRWHSHTSSATAILLECQP